MSLGWAHAMFDAADWDFWLLMGGVLVVCWGLVVAATATLFRSAAPGRLRKAPSGPRWAGAVGSQQPTSSPSQQAGGADA